MMIAEIPPLVILDDDEVTEFYDCMLSNTPALIRLCNSTRRWQLRDMFCTEDKNNFGSQSFTEAYGDHVILVDICNGLQKEEMKISEFITRINEGENLYAKDWHFFQLPNTTSGYEIPSLFCDDWLNTFWQRCKKNADDYRFLYIGGANTMTAVHHDVLYSYSWSVNLRGQKRWRLWRPEETCLLFADDSSAAATHNSEENAGDYFTRKKATVRDARGGRYDPHVFPGVARSTPLIFVQEEEEAVFVPSGWYHMVENVTPDADGGDGGDGMRSAGKAASSTTVSVNHNWINGFNVYKAWKFLVREINDVRVVMWEFLENSSQVECAHRVRQEQQSSQAGESLLRDDSRSDSSLFSFPSMTRGQVGMGSDEWLHHCELTLRVNCGLGIKDFLEMVVSRVVCLCKVHFDFHQSGDGARSKDGDFVDMSSSGKYSPFITTLLEELADSDQEADAAVYQKLARHPVTASSSSWSWPPQPLSPPSCSTKIELSDEESGKLTSPSGLVHDEDGFHCEHIDMHRVSGSDLMSEAGLDFPLSSFQFCMLEVLRIVVEIRRSSCLIDYLRAIYCHTSETDMLASLKVLEVLLLEAVRKQSE